MMAMQWSWAFGNETQADLESLGFVFTPEQSQPFVVNALASLNSSPNPLNAYTYSGSPDRYGLGIDQGTTAGGRHVRINLPNAAFPGLTRNKGIFTFAYRAATEGVWSGTSTFLSIKTLWSTTAFEMRVVAGQNTVNFYVHGTFKGTSSAINIENWNYFAVVFDSSADPYDGTLYINGVQEATGIQSRTAAEISTIEVRTTQDNTGNNSIFGQFITYNDPVGDLADAVSPDNFVTRIVPNANGAGTVGTWTPTGAANNWQAVSPPIDNTTYANNAAPTPGDRLEAETASATDLQTLLGINPSSIKGATVHSISLATSGTAKIGIQEGGSELLAPADPIQTGDTYIAQSYPNNPSGSTQATGTIGVVGVSLAGDTVVINGTALTAVSGARSSGSDDFSISSGTQAGIRDDLLAAINDPLNSFTEIVEGVSTTIAGPNPAIALTATANYSGTAGDSITLAESTGGTRTAVSGASLSGGADSAWVGGDQPILVYEIDTV